MPMENALCIVDEDFDPIQQPDFSLGRHNIKAEAVDN